MKRSFHYVYLISQENNVIDLKDINAILNITRYTYLKREIDYCHQVNFLTNCRKKDFSSVDFKFYDDQISSILYSLDIPRGVAYSSSLAIPCKWEAYFGRNQRQRSWYASILQVSNRYLIEIK